MSVRRSYEPKRGCGFRKTGGLYLVSGAGIVPCGRFPIEATTCPTCGHGIKPSRTFTWVDGDAIKKMAPACSIVPPEREFLIGTGGSCPACPMDDGYKLGRTGLVWIGEKYYPTPESFMIEAAIMGVSRRLTALPKGLVDKETGQVTKRVFLAHRKVIPQIDDETGEVTWLPGIFSIWKPERVEKVVTPEVTEEEEIKLRRRGIEPVIVEPMQVTLPLGEEV